MMVCGDPVSLPRPGLIKITTILCIMMSTVGQLGASIARPSNPYSSLWARRGSVRVCFGGVVRYHTATGKLTSPHHKDFLSLSRGYPRTPPLSEGARRSYVTRRGDDPRSNCMKTKEGIASVVPQETRRPFDVRELQALSDYFYRPGKDNATVYFYATADYGSVPEAVHAESVAAGNWSMSIERAQKLHQVGAVYRLGDKFKRTTEQGLDGPIKAGEGFRVYLYPRTFPGCYVEDYSRRVAYEDEDVLIVDKPPGCPCSPHVSNKFDCLDVTVGASLGKQGLIRLNRLDTVTSGLVTIGKSPKGAKVFQEELRRQRIHKVYRALLEGPVPIGPLRHYMASDVLHRRPAPRAISTVAHPDWKHADSNVLSCTPIPIHQLSIDEVEKPSPSSNVRTATRFDGRHDQVDCYYEVEVELITGRTHQLRAQFAAMEAPIVADSMYKPMSGYVLDDLEDPAIHSLYPICLEPKGRNGVALQCYQLRFLKYDVSAGEPWWRRKEVSTP